MPNRILKESINTSESLSSVSQEAENLFLHLIVTCDDWGRFDGRPVVIKGRCYPLRNVTVELITNWLNELTKSGMVNLYQVKGQIILELANWRLHQRVRAEKSKYPNPPTIADKCPQLLTNAPVSVNDNVNVIENRITRTKAVAGGVGGTAKKKTPVNLGEGQSEAASIKTPPKQGDSRSEAGMEQEPELAAVVICYEQNLGMITPIIAESLKDIAKNYPPSWFPDAVKIAVKAGVRKLNYIESILERWQTEGKDSAKTKTGKHDAPKWLVEA